jgi:hypothetical protein
MKAQKMDPYVPEKRGWRHYFKMSALYVTLIGGAYALYFTSAYLIGLYQEKAMQDYVTKMVQAMNQAQKDDFTRVMADTYGGATPRETLRMYISAVEKGDYESASKYFIGTKQAGELESLGNSPKKNIGAIIRLLKQAANSTGSYSADKKRFEIKKPLLVDFQLYPNGIWKIVETKSI